MTDPTPPTIEERPPPPEMLAPGVLIPAFVFMIVVGFALFSRGVGTVAGNELSKHQSVMAAVNAATLTGFQAARTPDYTPAGQFVLLGLMIAGTLFSLIGGGLAVLRIARIQLRDGTVAIAAIVAVGIVAILGAIADRGVGRTACDGAYQAVSAFGNCGLYIGHLPTGGDPRTTFLLLPLAFAGSLGLPVLLQLLRARPSRYTWRVLGASAAIYLLTFGALVPLLAVGHEGATFTTAVRSFVHGEAKFGDVLSTLRTPVMAASREAINARSAGFPFRFMTSLPAASTAVIWVAMLIGGAPGGTAGGVKVTTVTTLAGGIRNALFGRPIGRCFGLAVGWVAAYLGILLVATVGLLIADPELPADRILFLAASALGNVGLSHDPVSPSTAGMYVLSLTMLAGRVLPVLVLWTIADRMPEVTNAVG